MPTNLLSYYHLTVMTAVCKLNRTRVLTCLCTKYVN